jgi:hypothetical protein
VHPLRACLARRYPRGYSHDLIRGQDYAPLFLHQHEAYAAGPCAPCSTTTACRLCSPRPRDPLSKGSTAHPRTLALQNSVDGEPTHDYAITLVVWELCESRRRCSSGTTQYHRIFSPIMSTGRTCHDRQHQLIASSARPCAPLLQRSHFIA